MNEYLKCDQNECSHIETHEKLTDDMVNKACPLCGSNLLTQEDWKQYSAVKNLMSLVDSTLSSNQKKDEQGLVSLHVHDGTTTLTTKMQKAGEDHE